MSTNGNRWVAIPTSPSGACKHCGHPTVRARGILPIARDEKLGGTAGFQICPRCDALAAGPPVR